MANIFTSTTSLEHLQGLPDGCTPGPRQQEDIHGEFHPVILKTFVSTHHEYIAVHPLTQFLCFYKASMTAIRGNTKINTSISDHLKLQRINVIN